MTDKPQKISEVAFADSSNEVLLLFKSYGFNVNKDCKELHLTEFSRKNIEEQILETLRDLVTNGGIRKYIITKSEECTVYAVKLRAINPTKNIGKSSSLRVLAIVGVVDAQAIIFHLFSKVGSNQKDNISNTEKNRIRKMVNELGNIKGGTRA